MAAASSANSWDSIINSFLCRFQAFSDVHGRLLNPPTSSISQQPLCHNPKSQASQHSHGRGRHQGPKARVHADPRKPHQQVITDINGRKCSNSFTELHKPHYRKNQPILGYLPHRNQNTSGSGGCSKSLQNLKDVMNNNKKTTVTRSSSLAWADHGLLPMTGLSSAPPRQHSAATSSKVKVLLTEVEEGSSSFNIVELIFKAGGGSMMKMERVLKVNNSAKRTAAFEEYRAAVKAKAGAKNSSNSEAARCAADGNELLRFHCAPLACLSKSAAPRPCGDPRCGACTFVHKGFQVVDKNNGICFSHSSRRAHEMKCGRSSTRTRMGMLVCRVIAGRVSSPSIGADFDSVGLDFGGVIIFDGRAVLPCFLIIYKPN
ncbi:hypothetical protein AMTRI_Chr12g237560 [Amborella trichopoda]|uniref:PARP catalytic domain-containing protein n=1 Tax=Amborella trichopoda TaxID=13333 RepID=W1P4I4_AMBTC|nr:uncharacterized protein LOC110006966 [Amborella trichopoda]ERN02828.1 hypothetical protein AMTR_s00086p00144610 [Amborella trichopoda]|eukprot:XP_020520904.1 uncharacterized protein LOC110006966 [Amborella trichopoda]